MEPRKDLSKSDPSKKTQPTTMTSAAMGVIAQKDKAIAELEARIAQQDKALVEMGQQMVALKLPSANATEALKAKLIKLESELAASQKELANSQRLQAALSAELSQGSADKEAFLSAQAALSQAEASLAERLQNAKQEEARLAQLKEDQIRVAREKAAQEEAELEARQQAAREVEAKRVQAEKHIKFLHRVISLFELATISNAEYTTEKSNLINAIAEAENSPILSLPVNAQVKADLLANVQSFLDVIETDKDNKHTRSTLGCITDAFKAVANGTLDANHINAISDAAANHNHTIAKVIKAVVGSLAIVFGLALAASCVYLAVATGLGASPVSIAGLNLGATMIGAGVATIAGIAGGASTYAGIKLFTSIKDNSVSNACESLADRLDISGKQIARNQAIAQALAAQRADQAQAEAAAPRV